MTSSIPAMSIRKSAGHSACASLFLCLALVAGGGCGGGGGSSGGGSGGGVPPLSPSFSLSTSQGSWQGNTSDAVSAAPPAVVDITFSDQPAGGLFYKYAWGGTAVNNVTATAVSNNVVQLDLLAWPAGSLGAGVYSDTVTVTVCLDQACTQPLSDSPQAVAVTYTVTGAAAPTTTVTWNITNITYQVDATSQAPYFTGQVELSYIPPTGLWIYYKVLNHSVVINDIVSAQIATNKPSAIVSVAANLQSPASLTYGFYSDGISFQICYDQACTKPVAGGQDSVQINYLGSAVQGVDYQLQEFMVTAASMAWNPTTSLLYLINYGTSAVAPLTLMELNPTTATMGRTAALTYNPSQLVLSSDGQYAYVLEAQAGDPANFYWVERFRMSDFGLDETLSLGSMGSFSISTVPGSPHAVAVNTGAAITIYDDLTPRPNSLQLGALSSDYASLAWWPDGSQLVGYEPTSQMLYTSSANASGLTQPGSPVNVVLNNGPSDVEVTLQVSNGLIYSSAGRVYDPVAMALQTPFPLVSLPDSEAGVFNMAIDPTLDRIYFLEFDGGNDELVSYSIAGRNNPGPIQFPSYYQFGTDLTRWGTNGIAFLLSDRVALVSGAVIDP